MFVESRIKSVNTIVCTVGRLEGEPPYNIGSYIYA